MPPGGDILAETDLSGNTLNEYIFFGGKRIAMLPAGGNPVYYVEDMLGTSRPITQSTGAVCGVYPERSRRDADFDPTACPERSRRGGEHAYTNTCSQNYKFEGKERDPESGLDNFGARYNSSNSGRFMSPDWSEDPDPIPNADLANPQTLNLYAYVANNPLNLTDYDGHDPNGEPAPAGKCTGFLCWIKFVLFGDPHKTKPAPTNDPIGPTLANATVGITNLLDRAAGKPNRQEPYIIPTSPEQAKAMNEANFALLFVPGLDVDALVADLARGAAPFAEGKELQAIIDELYQTTDKFPGGTAGAVRAERAGIKVGGKIHTLKAAERASQLRKLIARGGLSPKDVALAKAIVQDLTNALTGK
ncbi:MAG: RHS repeat-associated core domain-containing protein [Candidatus Acidiferrum sp.]